MNIPNIIKIFGHEYEIVFQDEKQTSNTNYGNHWPLHSKIYINIAPCQSQKESTFIHEILEAVNWHLQLKLKHTQISLLEVGLYQILNDNRLLNG